MAIEKGVLQPAPLGLLGLLQLKQRGQNPDTLSDTVLPTIDLREWYMVENREVLPMTFDLVGPADQSEVFRAGVVDVLGNTLTVPQGEVWYVWNMSGLVNVDTAGTFAGQFAMAVQPIATLGMYQYYGVTVPVFGLVATANDTIVIAGADVRRWFLAGSTFGWAYSQIGVPMGQQANFEGYIEITRIKI